MCTSYGDGDKAGDFVSTDECTDILSAISKKSVTTSSSLSSSSVKLIEEMKKIKLELTISAKVKIYFHSKQRTDSVQYMQIHKVKKILKVTHASQAK